MTESQDPWKRLVDASKLAPDERKPVTPPTVQIKTLRQSVQTLILTLTWRRLSMIAALLGILALALVYLLSRSPDTNQPIIPTEPPLIPIQP